MTDQRPKNGKNVNDEGETSDVSWVGDLRTGGVWK